jgi:phospholipid/cholesterol/gamma-HCH transport system permease protein
MPSTSRRSEPAAVQVEGGAVRCSGSWTVNRVGRVERPLGRLSWPEAEGVVIDATSVDGMDTAGAWLLCRMVRDLERNGRSVTLRLRQEHEGLLGIVGPVAEARPPPRADRSRRVDALGRSAWSAASELGHLVRFAGETALDAVHALRGPLRERRRQVLQQVQTAGFEALPTTALLSFAIGAVIAFQAVAVLRPMGAGLLAADLVGLAMLRDLAPLVAAIVAAARSGSAFAAQIGASKVTGEIDSLRGMGAAPVEVLVLPRIVALALALPLLTAAADVLGVTGGLWVAHVELAIDPADFLGRIARTLHPLDYLVGLAKAPVFGVIVATVGCYQGLHVDEDAESVGRRTTVAVVESMFLVIVVDGLVNVLSRSLGI